MAGPDRRYVIYGAGAIGGAIGGRLAQAGHAVVLIARGAHGEALDRRGLELRWPDGEELLTLPVAAHPGAVEWRRGDVVVLATKSQDTPGALEALAGVCPASTPVFCAQNGVDNERSALRRFAHVYAVHVILAASHLSPGVVRLEKYPLTGILDLGRYPSGVDEIAEAVAGDLSGSGFLSTADPAIMRRKYRKLVMNLGNALDAAAGPAGRGNDLSDRARAEAEACFAAAGIDCLSVEDDQARRAELHRGDPKGWGDVRSSSWQSLARATGSIEADYLNGEIVLLGRLHGIPTPVNAMLQRVANRLAATRAAPGSMTLEDLLAEIDPRQ